MANITVFTADHKVVITAKQFVTWIYAVKMFFFTVDILLDHSWLKLYYIELMFFLLLFFYIFISFPLQLNIKT